MVHAANYEYYRHISVRTLSTATIATAPSQNYYLRPICNDGPPGSL
jgi:hypothetical protein